MPHRFLLSALLVTMFGMLQAQTVGDTATTKGIAPVKLFSIGTQSGFSSGNGVSFQYMNGPNGLQFSWLVASAVGRQKHYRFVSLGFQASQRIKEGQSNDLFFYEGLGLIQFDHNLENLPINDKFIGKYVIPAIGFGIWQGKNHPINLRLNLGLMMVIGQNTFGIYPEFGVGIYFRLKP